MQGENTELPTPVAFGVTGCIHAGKRKQGPTADATAYTATSSYDVEARNGLLPSQPAAVSPPSAPQPPPPLLQPALMPTAHQGAPALQPIRISQPQTAHVPSPQSIQAFQPSTPGSLQQPSHPKYEEREAPEAADPTTQEELPLLEKLFYPLPEDPKDLDYQGTHWVGGWCISRQSPPLLAFVKADPGH